MVVADPIHELDTRYECSDFLVSVHTNDRVSDQDQSIEILDLDSSHRPVIVSCWWVTRATGEGDVKPAGGCKRTLDAGCGGRLQRLGLRGIYFWVEFV